MVDIIALFIAIGIGAIVVFHVTGAMAPMSENSPAAQTFDNVLSSVEERSDTAYNLMTVLVIVVVAAIILFSVTSLQGAFAPPGGKT